MIINSIKHIAYAFSLLLPWPLRRFCLVSIFRYEIHPTAKIGFSWILPRFLKMAPYSRIGHLNLCKGLECLILGEKSTIGRLNWITGFPLTTSQHFQSDLNRQPTLVLGDHSAVTNRHILDCTNTVTVGRYATVAGFRSQILTHSIDLSVCEQRSHPVYIGDYCFVGTGVIILGGSCLPDRSVLAAGSVLAKPYQDQSTLYAGTPARPIKLLDTSGGYFTRDKGFVR